MLPKSVFSTLPTPGLGIIFQELFSAIVPQGWCFDLVIALIGCSWICLDLIIFMRYFTMFVVSDVWSMFFHLSCYYIRWLFDVCLHFRVLWASIFVGIFLLKPQAVSGTKRDEATASTWIDQCPILLSSMCLVPAVCSPHQKYIKV